MRIRLREREPHTRRWKTLLDERVDPAAPATGALTLSESSDLVLRIYAEGTPLDARLYAGDMLVASNLRRDRPDFLIVPPADSDERAEYLYCSGRLLRDWVGQTELRLEVGSGGSWRPVFALGLFVTAGKIEQEAFEALCTELANHSAAVLLDVYGKTFLGLEPERRPGETAPLAVLQRLRQTLDHLTLSLRAIARQPAYRLKAKRVREPALTEQGVSDLTLEEACVDPTLAVAHATGLRFREHVREVAAPHFDLAEHRLIAGFLHFLAQQIVDLRTRAGREMIVRQERRAYRHRRGADGGKTWWEAEDLPRIDELRGLLTHLEAMTRELAGLRRHAFLPPAARLEQVPVSTPLFRSHRAYASAFRAIVGHFTAFRVRLDDEHLVMRAKSLPVLYEWWCVLDVVRALQGCLRLCAGASPERGSPFRRLAEERERLVIDFAADQAIDFEDERGRLVRLRYTPSYRGSGDSRGLAYGLLGPEEERTPDIALEVFGGDDGAGPVPELIIVLDAKYSSDPHDVKLDDVRRKYGKIGLFRTGMLLARQVWAMTPRPPEVARVVNPEWAAFCTVDNLGFWSDEFDMRSTVAGVVQAKPNMPAGRSPLEALLRFLLKRSGVRLRG